MSKKINSLKDIALHYKNFFFDLDGVLWWGDESVPGSLQTLNYLRSLDKNLFFVTNSSVRSREELQKRFDKFGFHAHLNECFPSSYIASLYLSSQYPEIKKIMCFGSEFLAEELRRVGLEVNHVVKLEENNKQPIQICEENYDPTCEALVVGYDVHMTYAKSCLACYHIQKGVKFFGTNPDKFTLIRGFRIPGCGSILSTIEKGSKTKAEISGKPNPFILNYIIEKNELKREECVMIGDNLDTDILFGNRAKISTVSVLSGVSKVDEVEGVEEQRRPTYYSQKIGE